MKNSKAYDLPVRVFHWTFATLFIFSFLIANFTDDDSIIFTYHMLSGMLMTFLVILRVFWGFVGSKTARFNSFRLKPTELVSYLKSILSAKNKRYLGHNPASSFAATLMMLFMLGLFCSGLMMIFEFNKHFFKEFHELIAYGFLVMVSLHIAGAVVHQSKHQDGLLSSMVTGKKAAVDGENEIKSNHLWSAVIFIIMIIAMISYLSSSFDQNSGKLTVFGSQLQLTEEESNKHHSEDEDEEYENHDD